MIVTPYLHHFCFRQKGVEHCFISFNSFVDSLFRSKRGRRIYWFVFTLTLCWWLTKRRRSIWFICMFLYACFVLCISFSFNCLIGIKSISLLLRVCFYWYQEHVLCISMHSCLRAYIAYLFVYCYAWVKGAVSYTHLTLPTIYSV